MNSDNSVLFKNSPVQECQALVCHISETW